MGFEIFNRKVQYKGTPAVSFTVLGRFTFNKAASAELEKAAVENALLMWDKEKRRIGMRPISKKDSRSYKLHRNKRGDGYSFSAATFLKYIEYDISETRSVPVRWDEQDQMFLMEVPEAYFIKAESAKNAKLKRREKQSEQA